MGRDQPSAKRALGMLSAMLLLISSGVSSAQNIIDYAARHHASVDTQGMVAVQNAIAAEVGAAVLAEGGNAVDAAVAVGMALSVTLPRAGNIGGGGFMLVYLAERDETIAIDYREKAPAAATRDMYLDADGNVDNAKARFSVLSAGVPGTVAGLHHALSRYGTKSWKDVVMPAVELARDGIIVSADLASALAGRRQRLGRDAASLAKFYKPDGSAYRAGERWRQPELAWALEQIANDGPEAFYQGAVADRIVSFMQASGGLITKADLAGYTVAEREPVRGEYREFDIVTMPPPSSGGVLLVQMLNVLEQFNLRDSGFGSARTIHVMTEAMRTAYADRSQHLGDPDYYEPDYGWLMSPAYAREIAEQIDVDQARRSEDVAPGVNQGYESPDTTHYSVMDATGNVVANTYTLNFSYGSGITVPGAGFLLNNEMDDFSAKPGTPNGYGLLGDEANAIEPGKRPLSSMTPTIVFRNGEPFLVTGSPGGSRIITTVLQIVLNVIEHQMSVLDAVDAPRFHHQWEPDAVFFEAGFSPDTLALLESMGHEVDTRRRTMGSAQSILFDGKYFRGAADPRRPDALAVGPQGLDCRTSSVACSY